MNPARRSRGRGRGRGRSRPPPHQTVGLPGESSSLGLHGVRQAALATAKEIAHK